MLFSCGDNFDSKLRLWKFLNKSHYDSVTFKLQHSRKIWALTFADWIGNSSSNKTKLSVLIRWDEACAKKRLRNDFYFLPCVEEEMDESAFSLICPSWLDLISAETNSRKCFERQRKLAEFSCSMYICGTYLVFWYMFLMNACDADSFSLIGCDNLGELVGCFACTLWLDFRNLQASPQFLRDEPPTRKLHTSQELLWSSTKTLHVQELVISC